jgi:hypothetical protein
MAENSTFEKKTSSDGKPNPKYVDLLDEDPKIAGQQWGVFSFLSPGNILKKREMFLFSTFVKQWDWVKSMTKFMDFLNFVAYKYNLNAETLLKDYNDYLNEEATKLKSESGVEEDYANFLDKNEDRLVQQFQRENAFQTSVHGFKARGNFRSEEEASDFAKRTRDRDPNHSVFVGPIGTWLPWDPNPYKTQQVEFMEEQLNQLHKEKIKNEKLAKDEFEKRIRETKENAIRENIEKAQKTGNKLTQTITESGELVGIRETVDFESREVADPDEAERIFKELKNGASTGDNLN